MCFFAILGRLPIGHPWSSCDGRDSQVASGRWSDKEIFRCLHRSPSLPIILDTSLKYRPVSVRGSTGVPSIGCHVLVISISADNRLMPVSTLVNNWLMSDRYASMYDRCLTYVHNWLWPDYLRCYPRVPAIARWLWPRQRVQIGPKHIANTSFALLENNLTGVYDYLAVEDQCWKKSLILAMPPISGHRTIKILFNQKSFW